MTVQANSGQESVADIGLVRKLLSLFVRREWWHVSLMFVLMVVGSIMEAAGVGLLFPVISVLAEPGTIADTVIIGDLYRLAGQPRIGRFVVGVLAGLLGVFVIKNIYLGFLSYWQNRFAQKKAAAVAQRLFSHYMAMPYDFHLKHNSSELIRIVTEETNALVSRVLQPLLTLAAEILTVIALIIVMLNKNQMASTVVIGVFLLASSLFYKLVRNRVYRWGKAYQDHSSQANRMLREGLVGIKDVQVYECQRFFAAQFAVQSNECAVYGGRQGFINALPFIWLETIAVAVLLGLVALLLMQQNSFALIIPTLGMFTAAAFRLMPSVNRVLVSLQNLRYSKPTLDLVYREMHQRQAEPVSQAAASVFKFERTIELINIGFTYAERSRPVLDGFFLSIGRGESIGIIGPSGTGKTTLVDMLLGLLRPDRGDIMVDGNSILANMEAWRRKVGYVPQQIYLTDDTLRKNIAFGLPEEEIDDAAIARAVQLAQLEELVGELPKGVDTRIGESGVRLSGGQRQRIGIARALYRDPELLVMDEATSALDSETEAAIVSAINGLHGKKTIIVVAHRLSTLEGCDRIVSLEKVSVREDSLGGGGQP